MDQDSDDAAVTGPQDVAITSVAQRLRTIGDEMNREYSRNNLHLVLDFSQLLFQYVVTEFQDKFKIVLKVVKSNWWESQGKHLFISIN